MLSSIAATLFVSAATTFPQAIESAAAAVDKADRADVVILISTKHRTQVTKSEMRVVYDRPSKLFVTVSEPVQNGRDTTHVSFLVNGKSALGYDHVTGEYLQRETANIGPLHQRVTIAFGDLGEPFLAATDGDALRAQLNRLVPMGTYKRTATANGELWTANNSRSGSKTVVGFDKFGRFLSLGVSSADGYTRWTLRYRPPSTPALKIPAGAKRVDSFVQRPAPPSYADAKTKGIVQASQRAYDKLRHVAFDVTEGSETTRVWVSGAKVREDQRMVRWAFDGKMATMVDVKGKRVFRGPARPSTVIDAAGQLGEGVDSATRWFLLGENPMRTLFSSKFNLRSSGEINLGGMVCDLISIEGPWKGSMLIRRKDGLLRELNVIVLDSRKKVVSSSVQTFNYRSIGTPLPASQFEITSPGDYRRATLQALVKPGKE